MFHDLHQIIPVFLQRFHVEITPREKMLIGMMERASMTKFPIIGG